MLRLCAHVVSWFVAAIAIAGTASSVAADDLVTPLKNAAMIEETASGYRYTAGQQDSHLVITQANGGLRFVDTGTRELRWIPGSCHRLRVPNGIAAACDVAGSVSVNQPLTVKVVARLGNDVLDASALTAAVELYALADAGNDVVYGGAGDDFVNGAQNRDRVWGGGGNDWIRTGLGGDTIRGGPGNDRLNGVYGSDTVRGGRGNDRTGGGFGDDRLYGGAGQDLLACGSGTDHAYVNQADDANGCEHQHSS